LPVGQRLFPGFERRFLLGQALLLGIEAFRRQAILDLALDFGLTFLFGLLFLAGKEKGQGSEQRENGKLLHGVV
jgi:hypothetical protein